MTAWEAGLKGVTIFRDGCKRAGILTTSDSKKDDETSEKHKTTLSRGMIIKADDNCVGKKRTLQTGCGTLHYIILHLHLRTQVHPFCECTFCKCFVLDMF